MTEVNTNNSPSGYARCNMCCPMSALNAPRVWPGDCAACGWRCGARSKEAMPKPILLMGEEQAVEAINEFNAREDK